MTPPSEYLTLWDASNRYDFVIGVFLIPCGLFWYNIQHVNHDGKCSRTKQYSNGFSEAVQTVATVARAPVRFSSSDFHPKSKFTKKCFYMWFPSLKMDVFFFSVSLKFFELIKDLMFSFSVHLLLYTLLNCIWEDKITARNCARMGLPRSV